MRSEAELREFFRRDLLPELRAYERRRKAALRGLLHWSSGAVAALGVGAALALGHPAPLALAGAFFVLRGLWIVGKIRRDVKRNLVSRVLSFWNPDLSYHPEGFVPESDFRLAGLFPRGWRRYRGEDLVTGRHGDTWFQFSELRVDRAKRGDGDTRVFSGLFFVADFHKSFRGRTVLLPDLAERAFGVFGRAVQQLRKVADGSLVTLEDPEFERLFKVYATDPTEARYILTPSLMERIVRLRRNTGSALRIGFAGERLHLALPLTTNLFELDPTKSAIGEEAMRAWIGELELVMGLVDELDLNTRIWSKSAAPPARGA